jgi:hypothetical protein
MYRIYKKNNFKYMSNGWEYLEQFNTGVMEAAGKKSTLKHVLVRMEHDVAKRSVNCLIDGTVEPEVMRNIPIRTEFMVRIKCADRESGIYLTAKGKACVKEIGHGPEGLQVRLDVKIYGIAAYRKQTDEKGIDFLEPLYNDMTAREDKKAKEITHYTN